MALFAGSTRVIPVTMTNFTNNQSKSGFTPSISSIIVTPDSGYTGLSQVTIKPIPSTYVLPSLYYTVTNSGTYDISRYSTATVSSMVAPVWGTTTLNISQARLDYNISINKGFNSINQTFSSSYILPSISGSVIIPSNTSQVAVESGKWTLGSIICEAIPSSVTIYKKIYDHTITDDEVNTFLSNQTSIRHHLFAGHTQLSSFIIGENITSLGSFAFIQCSYLTGVSFPKVSSINNSTFYSCSKLVSAYFSSATDIAEYAFANCMHLSDINFPNVSMVHTGTFYLCETLTNANLPNLTSIYGGAFSYCYNLSYVSFSLLSLIDGGYTFYYCSNLSYINLPVLKKISGVYTFGYCKNLKSVNLPQCSFLSGYTFTNCSSLQTISLPAMVSFSAQFHFNQCYNLTSLYLMNSIVATLSNSNTFQSTPIGGYSSSAGTFGSIYVPSSLLTQYQTATNWSYFSNRFVGI